MNKTNLNKGKYLSALGAFALAFGCAVGWGAFVMPGNTFLPVAGPIGTAIGIALGAIVMIIIARNYHYLMNRYPDGGGAFTYTSKCFGYDHGFLTAWFLILTYIAVIWANATALPIIARTLFGSTFQFGFHYQVAGFDVYFGEILLVAIALGLGALACLRRRLAAWAQIVLAIILFLGVIVCFIAAAVNTNGVQAIQPAFSENTGAVAGTVTIFALAPWAFVGFESISHSAGEAKFSLKRAFTIMVVAIVAAALIYALLAVMATFALPEGCSSWTEYIAKLGDYSGFDLESKPTFFAANAGMGKAGLVILGLALLGGIFTGIIGNYVALSRLVSKMSEDGVLPKFIGKLDKNNVPRNAILIILAISLVLPFFGRTAISWIVDVTTIGATIAFAIISAAAIKTAHKEGDKGAKVVGIIGLIISVIFAIIFLVPNVTSVATLSRESYLILTAWSILGFIVFYLLLRNDRENRFGHTTMAWIVLLGLIIFTSSVWLLQSVSNVTSDATKTVEQINASVRIAAIVNIVLIVIALVILFAIYSTIQKRERRTEIEKFLAEETSRAKTSFLSNMSHEIRTPMNAIIGLDNIALRDPDLSSHTREQLEKIGASAKHLLSLINDILDMSRIESGRMVLKNEEFSFRELIDQVNIIINGQCVDKGLHYECSVVGDVADYYFGDDMKLKQVLINILGNSVKFTGAPGDVSLTVEEIAKEDGERVLRFKMKDTGIGMDKEFIPKIFDAFSQENATSTNKYGGSGLGMAITKNFVDMMKGDIKVESEKGKGSTFTVTVRLGASSRVYQAGITIPEGLTALVVDDDEIACEHAKVTLASIGINAGACASAREALEHLRRAYESGEPYKLLLTDYKMPDMDGIELTKAVRKFDNGETAIIILTGYNIDDVDKNDRDEVDDVLAKPLFKENLTRSIHEVLWLKGAIQTEEKTDIKEEEFADVLKGCRVLMAEDVDANAEILADLLDLEDITCERAENGQKAVDNFVNHEIGYYNAILMDVRMPVMDGLTATGVIRALEREDAKSIPIIAMTANVFDEDVRHSLDAGMNAHLSKPIEPDKLYSTLAKFILANRSK